MKDKTIGLIVIFFLFIVLIAISIWSIEPVEEVLNESIEVAEQTFYENSKEPNRELDYFSLFLPEEFDVIEQGKHNLLLEEHGQTFILFYNELEARTSRVNYEEADQENSTDKWLQSFEDNDRFGYIYMIKQKDQLEIQLGVGGVKVTTISSKNTVKKDVQSMMRIANSLAY